VAAAPPGLADQVASDDGARASRARRHAVPRDARESVRGAQHVRGE
jgi:hypothetical protein